MATHLMNMNHDNLLCHLRSRVMVVKLKLKNKSRDWVIPCAMKRKLLQHAQWHRWESLGRKSCRYSKNHLHYSHLNSFPRTNSQYTIKKELKKERKKERKKEKGEIGNANHSLVLFMAVERSSFFLEDILTVVGAIPSCWRSTMVKVEESLSWSCLHYRVDDEEKVEIDWNSDPVPPKKLVGKQKLNVHVSSPLLLLFPCILSFFLSFFLFPFFLFPFSSFLFSMANEVDEYLWEYKLKLSFL